MDDNFILLVSHKGKQLEFPVRLLNYGYSYKLEVTIDDTRLVFEPDEERNWRALISYEDLQHNKPLDKNLVESIAEAINRL